MLPASQPASQPAALPARLPARPPACPPARLPACPCHAAPYASRIPTCSLAHCLQVTVPLHHAAVSSLPSLSALSAAPVTLAPKPPTAVQVPAATEAQQTGYNIKRNEFEPEYDYEAETIIAELADFK